MPRSSAKSGILNHLRLMSAIEDQFSTYTVLPYGTQSVLEAAGCSGADLPTDLDVSDSDLEEESGEDDDCQFNWPNLAYSDQSGGNPNIYDEIIAQIGARRYWLPRIVSSSTREISIEKWFHQPLFTNPRVFRAIFRMDKESFYSLTDTIKNHAIFQNQSLSSPQKAVKYQLAVFLYKMGGSGTTQVSSAVALGVGDGTIPLYINRVLKALLSMKDIYICWPNSAEKNAHKQRVCNASMGVFPGCIGFIDGTFIVLKYAPTIDWYYYYNRKGSYALNAMVVCNDLGRILYTRVGDTSAVHDARVFESSQLSQHPQNFLAKDEFLIGDSAYTNTDNIVTPFKKPIANNPQHRLFNATLSSRRIAIEHVFGHLKARFPAITSVPIRIAGIHSHKRVVDWFESACIIHNFLLGKNDGTWDETGEEIQNQEDFNREENDNDMIIGLESEQMEGLFGNEQSCLRDKLFQNMKRML